MPSKMDLRGQKFGHLQVISGTTKNSSGKLRWVCICDCGNTIDAIATLLVCGKRTSCGCVVNNESRLYQIWADMRSRCTNSNIKCYGYYGGKGITYYPAWDKFEIFKSWALDNGYHEDLVIDRINSCGNYEPTNCQWVTKSENARRSGILGKKLTTEIVRNIRGSNATAKDLASKYQVTRETIYHIRSYHTWKDTI